MIMVLLNVLYMCYILVHSGACYVPYTSYKANRLLNYNVWGFLYNLLIFCSMEPVKAQEGCLLYYTVTNYRDFQW